MVQMAAVGVERNFNVSQSLTMSELREGHCQKLLPATELTHTAIAIVSPNIATKVFVLDEPQWPHQKRPMVAT
jgi:hypothetical protein